MFQILIFYNAIIWKVNLKHNIFLVKYNKTSHKKHAYMLRKGYYFIWSRYIWHTLHRDVQNIGWQITCIGIQTKIFKYVELATLKTKKVLCFRHLSNNVCFEKKRLFMWRADIFLLLLCFFLLKFLDNWYYYTYK